MRSRFFGLVWNTGRVLAAAVIIGVSLLACRGDQESPNRDVPLLPPFAPLTAPGAAIDRVGLPNTYRERFGTFFENDRAASQDIHVAYINAIGAQVKENQQFPYGTVIVLEIYPATLTATGETKLDASGRFVRGALATIFVMRKEPGFGEKYGPDRTGDWEYADYRPNGDFALVPEMTHVCAQCHLAQSNAQQDWLIGANRFFVQRRQEGTETAFVSPTVLGRLTPIVGLLPIALAVCLPLLLIAVFASRYGGIRHR